MEQHRDEALWQIAKRRAEFRKNLYSYLIINGMLWIIWWFTLGKNTGLTGWPWPAWVMLFWGVGILLQYVKAYHGDKSDMAEREYEKLKRKKQL